MDERTESLLVEVNKLHARKELSQTVGADYFEPGMMEYLDQSEGLFDVETGEVILRFEVKGTRYEGRTEQIEKVQLHDDVLVRRDGKNSFNANNFELLTTTQKSLGNVPAELCNVIAPLYDSGELRLLKARVSFVEPISKRSRHAKQAVLFVELKLEIKQTLVSITKDVDCKETDIDIVRSLIAACNDYLDTVRSDSIPHLIYKDGNHWADAIFDSAMKKFRKAFKSGIKQIEDRHGL